MRQARVWTELDREPFYKPKVTDRHGRLWRWDPDLVFWIHEGVNDLVEGSCASWQTLMYHHGPLTER